MESVSYLILAGGTIPLILMCCYLPNGCVNLFSCFQYPISPVLVSNLSGDLTIKDIGQLFSRNQSFFHSRWGLGVYGALMCINNFL